MIQLKGATVYAGNNLDILPTLPDNSVDSIVTDPPYELGFMGKKWDNSRIAYSVELWKECLRVLKPGGHLLSFGGTRTWHRVAVAIEDAGFEVRDSMAWLYGSGFPKSHNVANAIDKKMGESNRGHAISSGNRFHPTTGEARPNGEKLEKYQSRRPESKGWEGWGTALKPAFEPIVVARKPLIGTVAENVLTHGTGGLNIDGSRIGIETITTTNGKGFAGSFEGGTNDNGGSTHTGRWPSNVLLDDYTAGLVDKQSGVLKSGMMKAGQKTKGYDGPSMGKFQPGQTLTDTYGDSGGASRFFYVADTHKQGIISVCENTPASIVANYFKTIRAIIESSAQTSVEDLPSEPLAQIVRSAGILCDLCATSIAHDLVALKSLATNEATSTHFQRYISDCVNSTLNQSLASLVGEWVNTDTIPTTTSFGKLFGCVLLATDENTRLVNLESDNDLIPFLYQAKASKRDRNEGLDALEGKEIGAKGNGLARTCSTCGSSVLDGCDCPDRTFVNPERKNFHPTVKPTDLMRYLIKLVTPPNGVVLDPFTGSGSTGKAAILEGFEFIGIELTEEYLPIIEGRLKWAIEQASKKEEEKSEVLF